MSAPSDLLHDMLLLALDNELYTSPAIAETATVLDVGTGTGTWACQLALRNVHARVYGIDLHQVAPPHIPQNVVFETVNVMTGFPFNTGTFDFVHSRLLVGGITDWKLYLQNLLRITKRGGYVEGVELELRPKASSVSTAIDSWTSKVESFLLGRGLEPGIAEQLSTTMESAGFSEVHDRVIDLPLGAWSEEDKARDVGRMALEYGKLHFVRSLSESLVASGAKPEEIDRESEAVIRELSDPKFQGTLRWHFCTGRKCVS